MGRCALFLFARAETEGNHVQNENPGLHFRPHHVLCHGDRHAQPGGLSGLSYAAVGEALTETLYMGLLVLLFSNLWGNRAGDAFQSRRCDVMRDNPYFCRLLRQGGTVAVMCPTMSPVIWLGTLMKNFPMAFFWNFFAAAPFTHWLHGKIFRAA